MPRVDEPVLLNNANLDSVKPNNVVNSPAGLKDSTNISNSTLQGTTPEKVATPDKSNNAPKPIIKLPFPNRQLKTNLDKQFGKFLEVVKDLKVTVPFTELITQIPSYAKFMKEILTRKRSISEVETVAFTAECSVVLQNKSPPKLKDPGSFSIPCHIGNLLIDNALCDLGASVSVMPLSVCSKLNMGKLKATNITLQMADRSFKYPLGVLEDVPVRVGKFYIPVDFVVLDMAEDMQTPIILGRPFLNTAGAVIDVRSGKLTLSVGDDKVVFNLNNAPKSSMTEEKCFSVNVVVNYSNKPQALEKDPLEAVSCVASFSDEIDKWQKEVDAIERALYNVGLGFEDEQVEPIEQVVRIEPTVSVPPDRVASVERNDNLKQHSIEEGFLVRSIEDPPVQVKEDPPDKATWRPTGYVRKPHRSLNIARPGEKPPDQALGQGS